MKALAVSRQIFAALLVLLSTAGPASAREDGWEWVDVPDSHCAHPDSGSTGFGVRFPTDPLTGEPLTTSDIFIYMQGGGACYGHKDCFGGDLPGGKDGAKRLRGYHSEEFETESKLDEYLYLSASNVENPFKNMVMVMVPYCTGDVHSGTNIRTEIVQGTPFQTHFVGNKNFKKILSIIKSNARFPHPARKVWLMGSSAGGGGANIQYSRVRSELKPTDPDAASKFQVHLIEDSSPGFPDSHDADRESAWIPAWPACPDGCSNARDVRTYNRQLDNTFRYAFLSFQWDLVTKGNAYPRTDTPEKFAAGLDKLFKSVRDANLTATANGKSHFFTADNTQLTFADPHCAPHVVTTKAGPTNLVEEQKAFIKAMVENSGTWQDKLLVPLETCPVGPTDGDG